MESSLLYFLFLFLALSLQIHARESQFFSKITHAVEASPKVSTSPNADEPAMDLPPQSHNGHGLYGRRDPGQFPSSTSTAATTTTASYNYNPNPNNAAYREPETTAEFSTQSYVNRERNYPNNIPSGFNSAEFSTESYENNKGRSYPNNIPSGFNSAAEFSTENYENNKGRNYPNNIPSGFTSTEHSNANNYIPSTFSDEEYFNRGSYETKLPNYSNNDEQYGMSDTRSLENGKYFYDVSAERSSKEYEPVKGNSERYGSYGYKNEAGGYQNNQENKEMQEEYVP